MKTLFGSIGLFLWGCLIQVSGYSAESPAADAGFKDDPAAHALYTQMVEALRNANSLSWVADYQWNARGRQLSHATYRIWLKKPNFARMEAMPTGQPEPSGILVGDGDNFWIYWPKEKPRYGWENSGKYGEEYERYRCKFYMKEPSPRGRHSIGHEAGKLGAGIAMTILDASTFHGYTDSLQRYIDAVRPLGEQTVGGEVCDGIEVSIMKHQRSWYLWLSRKDHLPRKLNETVRVSYEMTAEETWSDVVLNAEIANNRFAWSAPADWKEWRMPEIEEGLLKPGTIAPDFDLQAINGGRIKLSNFRGQVVWLNKWRCG